MYLFSSYNVASHVRILMCLVSLAIGIIYVVLSAVYVHENGNDDLQKMATAQNMLFGVAALMLSIPNLVKLCIGEYFVDAWEIIATIPAGGSLILGYLILIISNPIRAHSVTGVLNIVPIAALGAVVAFYVLRCTKAILCTCDRRAECKMHSVTPEIRIDSRSNPVR